MCRRKKIGLLLAGGASVLIVIALFFLPVADLSAAVERVIGFFREAGPVAFFLAMALLPAVGFPLAAFTLVAGPVFGPTMGVPSVVVCTIAATSANVALSYWIASRALRPFVKRALRWFGYSLPEIHPQRAWPIVLVVRIVPGPPFFLQSYLLAVANAPFGIYMVASTLVPACYLSATIILGDALMRRDPSAMVTAGAIFFVAGAVIHQLRKRLSPRAAPDLPPPSGLD